MVADGEVMGFIPTVDATRSRRFYEDVLGLRFVSDDPFALVVESKGTQIRIAKLHEFTPAPYTILGWRVKNIEHEAHALSAKGVVFKRYPPLEQSDTGIWTSPSGARIAWFADPDGNVLSISEHADAVASA